MNCHGMLQWMTGLMVGVLCLGACAAPAVTPAPIPPTVALVPSTVAATSVSIPPTASSTSVPPAATPIPYTPTAPLTSTPRPTATSTPIPLNAPARAFAEPIPKAVANRPPDYQDDFGNPKTGWPVLARHDGDFDGEMGYSDGEYFLLASPSTSAQRWIQCWLQVPNLDVSDFVLDLDARFVTAESLEWRSGMFYVHFRAKEKDVNSVTLMTDRVAEVGMETREKMATLATFKGDPIKRGANHLRIIARRPQVAVYVNGQPLYIGQDYSPDKGPIILGIANAGKVPLLVHVDNLQVWDISKLSMPSGGVAITPRPTAKPLATVGREALAVAVVDHSPVWTAWVTLPPGPGDKDRFHAESENLADAFNGIPVALRGPVCQGASPQFVKYKLTFSQEVALTAVQMAYAGGNTTYIRLYDGEGKLIASKGPLRGGNIALKDALAVPGTRGKVFFIYIENSVSCWFQIASLSVQANFIGP